MDVVLAIDTSSSMRELTSTGRSKLDAARAAAAVFLDQVDWRGGNQAAIVTFDATARLAQALTGERGPLDAALAGMVTGRETCLPCAVAEADRELAGPRHRSGHTPVLVLLTDGRSNPRPVAEAVAAAEAAKARGVVVFTIGVGANVDDAGLAAMASRAEYYYRAPDAEALAAIYRAVAVTIPARRRASGAGGSRARADVDHARPCRAYADARPEQPWTSRRTPSIWLRNRGSARLTRCRRAPVRAVSGAAGPRVG